MMKKQLSIIVIALLTLAACGSSGKPISFNDQPGQLKEDYMPYAAELMIGDDFEYSEEDVPLVHRNFIEGCMSAAVIEFEENSEQLINLATRCGCNYQRLREWVKQLYPNSRERQFKQFEDYDKLLKNENGFEQLSSDVKEIFKRCQS